MDSYKKFCDKLNPKQQEAVDYTDGPVLVLAGPGTGKTELLSVRAANIISQKKALPESILILSFTNAAAKAMKERLVKILGPYAYNIETATFHSFANSIILESEEAADYIQERVQISDIEQVKIIEYILDNTKDIDVIRPFRSRYHYRNAIQNKITELKREGISPQDFEKFAEDAKPDGVYINDKDLRKLKALAVIYKLYEEYKSGKNKDLFDERGRYDYDDMILLATEALKNEAELKRQMQSRYTYVMVDEFQDTNGAQMDLLFELAGQSPKGGQSPNPNLCCVGDDDQSIFRFQGASIGNFRTLRKKYPGLKEIPLEKNYRSTPEIIKFTDKIIKFLPEKERMFVKKLVPERDFKKKNIEFYEFTTESEELVFITEKIKEIKKDIEKSADLPEEERKAPYNQIAVLVRKRANVLKLVDAFLRAGIPYATDGKEDISGERRVRQMLDVLDFAHLKNATEYAEKDTVFYRIITSDYFRIPFTEVLKFIAAVKAKKTKQRAKGEPLTVTLVAEFLKDPPKPMQHAAKAIESLLNESETRPVHAILMEYIEEAGVYKYILETYDKNELLRIRELRALTSFVNMVKNSDLADPAITLSDFIDEIETRKAHQMALTGDLVTMTQEGVRIFTAHGAKGTEFHTVLIPFCLQDKSWPLKPQADLIPLPPEIFKDKERITDKRLLRELDYYDETRLFYVASTRAKANLIYTASPTEDAIRSSYISNAGLEAVESALKSEEQILSRFLEQGRIEDPFIGTEKILRDLVSELTLNPTSINNYINCHRKYLYDDVLFLPSEKNLSLTFGNCVHKALEDTYGRFKRTGKFPDFEFFRDSFKRELDHEGVEDSIRANCLNHLETLKDWFGEESKAPIKPFGLEKRLSVMIGDNLTFSGKYDKTESAGDGAVRVIDYKTGNPDDHIKKIKNFLKDPIGLGEDECEGYLRQLVAYKLLFDRQKQGTDGYRVSHGKLVFVEPVKKTVIKYDLEEGEFVNEEVEITEDMVKELEGVIKDCWRDIMGLKFDKLPERIDKPGKCRGCAYDTICWGGS